MARLSAQGIKVLSLFASAPSIRRTGFEISKAAKVGSGTLYPLLARFEAEKILTSEWETEEPVDLKRPRRRYYLITREGKKVFHAAMADLNQFSAKGDLAWNT
ncbi:PadR family transcriptional regulator [Beijerinckia sp. L45]|uniref:PadR family transcriptional regulator n=1 Tax=Beijerinckia sp. L45 TaxID=1641855 RepID=UPI00131BEE7E|nr:helix-turn-helix transcriptional regulator [Beijerinckia sp. L45]